MFVDRKLFVNIYLLLDLIKFFIYLSLFYCEHSHEHSGGGFTINDTFSTHL